MKRLLIVVVAVLSLVSFSGVVMAQDSTSTAPSGEMAAPKKTTMHRKHKARRHHKMAHHTTMKADSTAAH